MFIALPSGQWHSTCSDRIPPQITVAGHRMLVSYEAQSMICYVSYSSRMPEATKIAGDGAHTHPYILRGYRGEGKGLQANEDEGGTSRRSGEPRFVNHD